MGQKLMNWNCKVPLDLGITLAFKGGKVSIGKLFNLLDPKENKKEEVIDFIYNRLYERYIEPSKLLVEIKSNATFNLSGGCIKLRPLAGVLEAILEAKLGFSIMANMCLLIETLQSFKYGWENSHNHSQEAFIEFFKHAGNTFKGLEGKIFYKHIRCGILHQGETTGGWKLQLRGDIVDPKGKNINTRMFLKTMENILDEYREELKVQSQQSSSPLWINFQLKLHAIIHNCKN